MSKLRNRGSRLVEPLLGVSKHFRNRDAIVTHLLMKYVFLYASRFSAVPFNFLTIQKDNFYLKLWQFKNLGHALSISPQICTNSGLVMRWFRKLMKITMIIRRRNCDVIWLFFKLDDIEINSSTRTGQVVDLIMTPDSWSISFCTAPDSMRLTCGRGDFFWKPMYTLWSWQNAQFLNLDNDFKLREFRCRSTHLEFAQDCSLVSAKYSIYPSRLLCANPAHLRSCSNTPTKLHSVSVFGEKAYEARVCPWHNQGIMCATQGMGIRFTQPLNGLKNELHMWWIRLRSRNSFTT